MGAKNYSSGSVMDRDEHFFISKEMEKCVRRKVENDGITKTAYYRRLIMNDLNIDELGRERP